MLIIHSILADDEVRQGLKVWVSHDQNDLQIIANDSPLVRLAHVPTTVSKRRTRRRP